VLLRRQTERWISPKVRCRMCCPAYARSVLAGPLFLGVRDSQLLPFAVYVITPEIWRAFSPGQMSAIAIFATETGQVKLFAHP
jgi:hypothetical protein